MACWCARPQEVWPGGCSFCMVPMVAASWNGADSWRVPGWWPWGLRWHGGEGQPSGICEIPIETFTRALDLLRDAGLERLCVLGLSKGAEAALWLSVLDRRIDAVVALSPTQ